MDLIYLLGLGVILFLLVSLFLITIADCDILTFLASINGKRPATEYKGKVVWITGASSGIGEAVAKQLAKYGAKIVLSARRKEELERVKKECLANGSISERDILVLPLDVTDLQSHEPSLQQVLNRFGKLDVLLSNAGQYQKGEFADIDLQVDRHIFEINVFSVVNMNRIVVKYFLARGGGQIGVVSSMAGKIYSPLCSAYGASKFAIHGYFGSLRAETVGKNIHVSLLCPGPVSTPIFNNGHGTKLGVRIADHPPQDILIMTPERCAHLCLVAMANRISESWISRLPVIPIVYLYQYSPLLSEVFFKLVGTKMIDRLRKAN